MNRDEKELVIFVTVGVVAILALLAFTVVRDRSGFDRYDSTTTVKTD